MPRVLALQLTISDANATHICKMTLYGFHYRLTTWTPPPTIAFWKRRFWMPVCTTDKSYEVEGVQLLYNKVFHRVHTQNVPQVPNVINLIHAWRIRWNIVATSCTRRLWLLFYRWTGRPTVLTPVNKTFRGFSPWSVSYEDECLFNFTTNLPIFT